MGQRWSMKNNALAQERHSPEHTVHQAQCKAPGSHIDENGLGFQISVQSGAPHIAANARLLVAAERHAGVEHAVAVDPYRAGLQLGDQPVHLRQVVRPDAGAQAEG